MINLNRSIPEIKEEIGKAPKEEFTRDFLIEVGVREKEGQNRSTLLKWLREEVKALNLAVDDSPDVPVDAPGEPPPGYEPTEEAEPVIEPPKPLMQEIDPRSCSFPFQNMDANLNPVCSIHNSGICLPCQSEVLRCRVVCFAESSKHRGIKQPPVVMKEKTVEGNPASVEPMDLSDFDE